MFGIENQQAINVFVQQPPKNPLVVPTARYNSVTSSDVLVSWGAPDSGADYYILKYRLQGNSYTTLSPIINTSISIPNLINGTYDFQVISVRNNVQSEPVEIIGEVINAAA